MAAKHKGLGRGLDALIHERESEEPKTEKTANKKLFVGIFDFLFILVIF